MGNITSQEELIEKFNKLLHEWRLFMKKPEVYLSSNPKDYINCIAYEKIILLGNPVIPLIIHEIKNNEIFLIYALEKITQIKPYTNDQARLMGEQQKAKEWLNWWEANKEKYIPIMKKP